MYLKQTRIVLDNNKFVLYNISDPSILTYCSVSMDITMHFLFKMLRGLEVGVFVLYMH